MGWFSSAFRTYEIYDAYKNCLTKTTFLFLTLYRINSIFSTYKNMSRVAVFAPEDALLQCPIGPVKKNAKNHCHADEDHHGRMTENRATRLCILWDVCVTNSQQSYKEGEQRHAEHTIHKRYSGRSKIELIKLTINRAYRTFAQARWPNFISMMYTDVVTGFISYYVVYIYIP